MPYGGKPSICARAQSCPSLSLAVPVDGLRAAVEALSPAKAIERLAARAVSRRLTSEPPCGAVWGLSGCGCDSGDRCRGVSDSAGVMRAVPGRSVEQQLAHRPGLTNATLARGTFVSRQAMHQLLGTLRSGDLVQSDGAGRHEHFTLTDTGAKRLVGASAAVAAVQERMLASFDSEQRQRLYADLAAARSRAQDSHKKHGPPPARSSGSARAGPAARSTTRPATRGLPPATPRSRVVQSRRRPRAPE